MRLAALCVVVAACARASGDVPPDVVDTACPDIPVVPFHGMSPQIISTLSIGSAADGFDLDGDGQPDNKLAAIAMVAQPGLDKALLAYKILIPIEVFDLPAAAPDACAKLAVYAGSYLRDDDGDGASSLEHGGDCNDHDPAIRPGAPEIVGNFKDDNCDGRADEDATGHASTDTMDRDGDGYSIAQGDCDDTNAMVHPGMPEICGDGLDNDCDGVADRSEDANGNPIACSPFDPNVPVAMTIDPRSFDTTGAPLSVFSDVVVSPVLELTAGPTPSDAFDIPIASSAAFQLKITGARIDANVAMHGSTVVLDHARLGGVISVRDADAIRGLSIKEIGLSKTQSVLDAVFANGLDVILALPGAKPAIQAMYPGCRTPDIDVDGDGLEAFCDSKAAATDDPKVIDVCIDGDGTVVHSVFDAMGGLVSSCAQAVDPHGKPRFVDGISLELDFSTTPLKSLDPAM